MPSLLEFPFLLFNHPKISIHQLKSISHELLSLQDADHEYVCVYLEGKIVKQMGSTVAYRKPTHALKEMSEIILPMHIVQAQFQHTEDGGKSLFFW